MLLPAEFFELCSDGLGVDSVVKETSEFALLSRGDNLLHGVRLDEKGIWSGSNFKWAGPSAEVWPASATGHERALRALIDTAKTIGTFWPPQLPLLVFSTTLPAYTPTNALGCEVILEGHRHVPFGFPKG